ncbi:Tim44/TimA family putative adaptor protein [Sphingomonas nostoxanthinifaciens]|uniref:Tim44/TimA family putative adaptor protein n=1 Tax=Sphingomonas nostoxanthinifaciens TaxID=2872652 RepID=UPI001CC214E2|nr:Tim44/TimA family putative adaptor protein [Sphingomonas nostoxanthinifaciens]UAK24224.1 Tim44/TimA family putative adaptor protein [Sphingomonas nostoxanthinifaciens]
MTTLIILAMVFVFVALRLWSVLGRRTGHEQPMAKADAVLAPRTPAVSVPTTEPAVTPIDNLPSPAAATGLRAISAVDPQFDAVRFVEGAKNAYAMVLEAFWRGDEEQIGQMVETEVAQAFAAAIHEREAVGEHLDNRLVSVEMAQIEDARVENQVAFIRIRFEADIAAVTRDRDGNVIAGSLTDAVPTQDVWTFRRAVRSADPNWILCETDEAA